MRIGYRRLQKLYKSPYNRRIYDRLDINYTYKDAGSIVLDLNIKSISEERSFKKYLYEFQRKTSNQIDLDALLD